MTMRFRPNVAIFSGQAGPAIIWNWLDFMTTASPGGPGWTLKSGYNDTGGTTFASDADLDSFRTPSGPWFVLQAPSGGREILCQRAASSEENWTFWYSVSAGFAGGADGVRATAADEQKIGGGSTFSSTANAIFHYGADDASPYGFWFTGFLAGMVNTCGLVMAPITAPVATDTDPVMFIFQTNSSNAFTTTCMCGVANFSISSTAYQCVGFLPGSNWQYIPALMLYANSTLYAPNKLGQNVLGEDQPVPIPFGRITGAFDPGYGFKGYTDWVQWCSVARGNGATYGTKAWIHVGDLLLPWDGTTTPTVI